MPDPVSTDILDPTAADKAVVDGAPDGAAPDLGYTVAVDAFSGPLDLLLFLVRKAELDIVDIPVATIADQFVALVAAWQRDGDLDLEGAGDFILMAATLLEIKARTIAPPPVEEGATPGEDDDDLLDPRADLIGKLLAYRRFKEAVGLLQGLEAARRLRVARQVREEIPEDPDEATGIDLGDLHVNQLSKLWYTLVARIGGAGPRTVLKDDLPIEDSIRKLTARAEAEGKVSLQQLFDAETSLQGRVSMLMATLECTRQRIVETSQYEQYGDVAMRFRPQEERPIVAVQFPPDEAAKRRRRRPPLVTYQAPPAVEGAVAPEEADETEEEKHETDEERFVRELNEACDLDNVLARAVDVEAGFQRYWEVLHPPPPKPVVEVVPPPVVEAVPVPAAEAVPVPVVEVVPVVVPVAETVPVVVEAAAAVPVAPAAEVASPVVPEPVQAVAVEVAVPVEPQAVVEPVATEPAVTVTVAEAAPLVAELGIAAAPVEAAAPVPDSAVEPAVPTVEAAAPTDPTPVVEAQPAVTAPGLPDAAEVLASSNPSDATAHSVAPIQVDAVAMAPGLPDAAEVRMADVAPAMMPVEAPMAEAVAPVQVESQAPGLPDAGEVLPIAAVAEVESPAVDPTQALAEATPAGVSAAVSEPVNVDPIAEPASPEPAAVERAAGPAVVDPISAIPEPLVPVATPVAEGDVPAVAEVAPASVAAEPVSVDVDANVPAELAVVGSVSTALVEVPVERSFPAIDGNAPAAVEETVTPDATVPVAEQGGVAVEPAESITYAPAETVAVDEADAAVAARHAPAVDEPRVAVELSDGEAQEPVQVRDLVVAPVEPVVEVAATTEAVDVVVPPVLPTAVAGVVEPAEVVAQSVVAEPADVAADADPAAEAAVLSAPAADIVAPPRAEPLRVVSYDDVPPLATVPVRDEVAVATSSASSVVADVPVEPVVAVAVEAEAAAAVDAPVAASLPPADIVPEEEVEPARTVPVASAAPALDSWLDDADEPAAAPAPLAPLPHPAVAEPLAAVAVAESVAPIASVAPETVAVLSAPSAAAPTLQPEPEPVVVPPSAPVRASQPAPLTGRAPVSPAPRVPRFSRTLLLVIAGTAGLAAASWWALHDVPAPLPAAPVHPVEPAVPATPVATTVSEPVVVPPVAPIPATAATPLPVTQPIPVTEPSPALLLLAHGQVEQWWWQPTWPLVVPWSACLPRAVAPESVEAFASAALPADLPVAVFAVDGAWAWLTSPQPAASTTMPATWSLLPPSAWYPALTVPALADWAIPGDLRGVPVAVFAEDLGWTVLCRPSPAFTIVSPAAPVAPAVEPPSTSATRVPPLGAWAEAVSLHDTPVTVFVGDLGWTALCGWRPDLSSESSATWVR